MRNLPPAIVCPDHTGYTKQPRQPCRGETLPAALTGSRDRDWQHDAIASAPMLANPARPPPAAPAHPNSRRSAALVAHRLDAKARLEKLPRNRSAVLAMSPAGAQRPRAP